MARTALNPFARLLLAANGAFAGLTVDVEDAASIKAAAALVAEDLMTFYPGNNPGQPVGIFTPPPEGKYYWWTGGALWSSLLDYRNRTGETTYDKDISEGLVFQVGPNDDYLPPNWTASIANDDQVIWTLASVAAEEFGLAEPSKDSPQWETIARNVFDELHSDARRVDSGDCEGAIRWQIFAFNNGYNYVNSFSNILYLNLASQLAYLTGNKTYEDAASDTFKLLEDIGFVNDKYDVFDGAQVTNCKSVNKAQWSANAAMLLEASAFMYNHTNGDDDWKERVQGLVSRTLEVFFPNGVAFETACEKNNTCTTDIFFFKSFLNRGLSSAIAKAPFTSETILPVLKSSAKAAAAQCTGGSNGRLCGFSWSSGKFDNQTGPAQQMAVLNALAGLLPAGGSVASNSTGTNTGSSSGAAQDSSSSGTPASGAGTQAVTTGGLMVAFSTLLASLLI
ncbi:glycoside hydrolase family 76 protein [Annulohypoxylon stygium]|nr:glycoside hydrolase family 76 protein [Annulohypoxylon stygium]